ncbi:MAG: magnesium transporter CorA family protein [Acidimicrobiia bacterium]
MLDDVWVDLFDPDAATLKRHLPPGMHSTFIDRILAPAGEDVRPRLDTLRTYVFGVLVVPIITSDNLDTVFHEVDVIMTSSTLITIRKSLPGCRPWRVDAIREGALRDEPTPGGCFHRLLDDVAERYLAFVDGVDGEIDELEDEVEHWTAARIRERISALRHEILHVRRALTPTRDIARAVLDDRVELETADLFPREIEIHVADTYDKLLRAADGLELSRDLLAGVRDYHQAQVAQDQNEVMKKLAAVGSMLLLPTLIVGFYGQNLKDVPEFDWSFGYEWSWFLIIATTVAQFVYFRRKGWL